MTSLLAASRENFAATLGFHAYAEAMRFSAATAARLVCALRQNNPPLVRGRSATRVAADAFANRCLKISAKSDFRAARTACFELFSVFDGRVQGQETIGYGYREWKSDTPSFGVLAFLSSLRFEPSVGYA